MSEWIEGPPPNEKGIYAAQFPIGVRTIEHDGKSFVRGDPRLYDFADQAIRHCRIPDLPKPLPLPRRFRAMSGGHQVVGVEFRPDMKVAIWSGPNLILLECDSVADFISHDRLENIEWIDPEERKPA